MPDHCRRCEPELPSFLLNPPAEIDVIARDMKCRIKSADSFQRGSPERHVAAGNVLGDVVGEEDVNRSSRCVSDGVGNAAITWRRDVRPADTRVITGRE